MLAPTLAILATLAHAILTWRGRSAQTTLIVPIFTIGIAASCGAAMRFGVDVPAGASAAELIVAPVVLMVLIGAVRLMLCGPVTDVRVWPLTGLIAMLGGIGLVERVDAMNAQLLLVLSLTVVWVLTTSRPETEARGDERVLSSLPGPLAGTIAAALTGWAILSGTDARLALGLVCTNMVIWSLSASGLGVIALAGIVSTGIGVGAANLVRVFGGAMLQPQWAMGQRGQALGAEIASRPYVPGFGELLPDIMLLVVGTLLVVLASESSGSPKRHWLTGGMLLGFVAAEIAWLWIGAG